MNAYDNVALIAYAAATAIHGVQWILILRFREDCVTRDRRFAATLIGTCFIWQLSNLLMIAGFAAGVRRGSAFLTAANWLHGVSLITFPLVFSYLATGGSGFATHAGPRISKAIRRLRPFLWAWTAFAFVSIGGHTTALFRTPVSMSQGEAITLYLMLGFFVLFAVQSASGRKQIDRNAPMTEKRAARSGYVAAVTAVLAFVALLYGQGTGLDTTRHFAWVGLISTLTSVPFSVYFAYRYYAFPFMDAFIRHSLAGTTVLIAAGSFVAVVEGVLPPAFHVLALCSGALAAAYAYPILLQRIDRWFLGLEETAEAVEERMGRSIRNTTDVDSLTGDAANLTATDLQLQWARIGLGTAEGSAAAVDVPGRSGERLSLGPRIDRRPLMSRDLRLARTAALEYAAQRERLIRDRDARRQIIEASELRELTSRAELRALRAQINPHFLFNTLNVLANLIHSRPVLAERVIEQLSDVFRYTLESTRREWTPLGHEIRFIEAYLEIERARFDERLRFCIACAPEAADVLVPPMLLQPLVENAVKHGAGARVSGSEVRIDAAISGGMVTIVIADSGSETATGGTPGSGIGLRNVRERLERLFNGNGHVQFEKTAHGARVELRFPANRVHEGALP